MPIVKTSYDTHDAFLVGLKDFATTNGWGVVYEKLSEKGQLGLSKGNCHISIGLRLGYNNVLDFVVNVKNEITGVTEKDHRMCLSLATSNVMTKPQYWGNPGQLPGNYSDTNKTAYINDMVGPFPNVWFFTDSGGNYIHVVLQRTADRYVSFTFGNIDVKGMSVPACGYAGGNYFIWWPENRNVASYSCWVNNWEVGAHFSYIESIGSENAFQAMIPSGVLNPSYNWPSQPFVTMSFLQPLKGIVPRNDAITLTRTEMLNHMRLTGNQTTTGGIPLHAIPIMYKQSDTQLCWLGELPDIRLVNIENLSPAQEISYGADTWVVFPWKQKGRFENSYAGSSPTADPNTWNYGIAIRKVA